MTRRLLFNAAAFVGMVWLVEYFFGWRTLLAPWAQQSAGVLFAAAALTFLTYWLRALRIYDYFRSEMAGRQLSCVKLMLQHNLLNNILPMRTGELSFPVLMARYFAVAPVRSLPVLFWFRVLDLHVLAWIGLIAVGSHWLPSWSISPLAGIWLSLPWIVFKGQQWLETRLQSWPQTRMTRIAAKVLDALPQSAADFWRSWAWTLANWLVKLGVFAWVLTLFIDAPLAGAWLAAITGDLTSVLPIHSFAGAGTYEAGVVAGLLPFGVEARPAFAAAVNLHLFLLASTLIGGLVSLLLPGAKHDG